MTSRPPNRARGAAIVCLEGPSAVGKSSLARALADSLDAAVVPELDATGAPRIADAEPWFTDRHAVQWMRALELRDTAPLVVIDCDPLKGLWYNRMHAGEGWPQVDVVGPLVREHLRRGTLAFPDLYVFLDATEEQLRARRAGDPTRTRRNFAKHVRTLDAHRRWFSALQAVAPERVAFLPTDDRDVLVPRVKELVGALPPHPPDSSRMLEAMIAWLHSEPPGE